MKFLKIINPVYYFLIFVFFIGIFPKFIQMFIILSLCFLIILKNKHLYLSKKISPFMVYSFIHFFSICAYCMSHDFNRFYAGINTFLLWVIGVFLFSYIQSDDFNIDLNFVKKISFINIIIIVFISILMLFCLRVNINISLFSRNLIGVDWINGIKQSRLLGFLEYSNLFVLYFFLLHPFALDFVKKEYNLIFFFFFLFISIIPIYLTNSRSGLLLLILYYLLIFFKITLKNKKYRKIFCFIFLCSLVILLICSYKKIYSLIFKVIYSRQGSNSMRLSIYKQSITKCVRESVIWGIGIKEYIGNYPLGSHSTFIGFFYKAGILGLLFGVVGFLILFYFIFKKQNWIYTLSFLCLVCTLIIEDLDGANWIIILFFIIQSIYIKGE